MVARASACSVGFSRRMRGEFWPVLQRSGYITIPSRYYVTWEDPSSAAHLASNLPPGGLKQVANTLHIATGSTLPRRLVIRIELRVLQCGKLEIIEECIDIGPQSL